MDESEIVPNWHVLVSIVGRVKGAPQAAGNFSIVYLLCLEYRVPNIYFCVEIVLRAIQTRVIFNPDV